MAQSRVTEYFNTRKRSSDLNPSKRRKVQRVESFDLSAAIFPDAEKISKVVEPPTKLDKSSVGFDLKVPSSFDNKAVEFQAKPKTRQKTTTKPATTRQRSARIKNKGRNEVSPSTTIEAAFKKAEQSRNEKSAELQVTAVEVTSREDDHGSLPGTPVKRAKAATDVEGISQKRARTSQREAILSDLAKTPDVAPSSSEQVTDPVKRGRATVSSRKKLNLQPINSLETSAKQEVTAAHKAETAKPQTVASSGQGAKEQTRSSPSTPLLNKVKATLSHKQLSSSPTTGKQTDEASKVTEAKQQEKIQSMKDKLSKCSQLSDLKKKLAEINQLKKEINSSKAASKVTKKVVKPKEEAKVEKITTPAYERFHALAQPGLPSLTLPYKYKILHEMFRSADTVVSMLHNRTEICTFDKLKAAVQEMVRKTFEIKNLGQIKAVYPTAYNMRQEKNLPKYGHGKKHAQYQLTVEPNFEDCTASDPNQKTKERVTFTATSLVDRRHFFHNSLVNIVKQHHQNFLESQNPPLKISNDKITRWHPKFDVDSVPNIDPADLPVAPEVQILSSARDVLSHTKGTLPSRVEKALKNVAEKYSPSKQEPEKTDSPAPSVKQLPVKSTPSIKGIPDSLLERIRVKEAKKLEECMTRKPEEEKRREMLARLPDLARIIRTHFITDKKSALPVESVVLRLVDSYKSGINTGDAHAHVALLTELIPDWLTQVNVKKGKFIKMNKNMDLNDVTNRLKGLMK